MIHERYGAVDRMSMDWSLWKAGEAREGMRAFAEKRAPRGCRRRSIAANASRSLQSRGARSWISIFRLAIRHRPSRRSHSSR